MELEPLQRMGETRVRKRMERGASIVRWRKLLREPGLAVLQISLETVTAILVCS